MGQVGSKMRRVGAQDGYTAGGLAHWCPACESMHAFALDGKNSSGAQWTWDGNVEQPTFTPSMNIRTGPRPTVPPGRPDAGQIDVCHYFLRNGVIEYLGDCTHALKGQQVALPPLPERLRDRPESTSDLPKVTSETSAPDKSKCPRCQAAPAEPWHGCPYNAELQHNPADNCTCCPACQAKCAGDV
jgi:hypothetical protein